MKIAYDFGGVGTQAIGNINKRGQAFLSGHAWSDSVVTRFLHSQSSHV